MGTPATRHQELQEPPWSLSRECSPATPDLTPGPRRGHRLLSPPSSQQWRELTHPGLGGGLWHWEVACGTGRQLHAGCPPPRGVETREQPADVPFSKLEAGSQQVPEASQGEGRKEPTLCVQDTLGQWLLPEPA